jgi:hypothetical protein
MSLAPQTQQILKHLQTVGSISGVEAAALYRCRALPRRIADIRDAGHFVRRELKKDATGQRYARYHYGQGEYRPAA